MHDDSVPPSPWVLRFAPGWAPGASVLDYACGGGRHARALAARGLRVLAADRDAEALGTLADCVGVEALHADLENGPWPFAGRVFDGVVVTNYLWRPRFAELLDCVRPGGTLIYETFMIGNERFGRPSNPDFLLRPGELLEQLRERFTIVAFEQGEASRPKPAMMQRVCAIRAIGASVRLPVIE